MKPKKEDYTLYKMSQALLGVFLTILSPLLLGDSDVPDFKMMEPIDHANLVYSDENKNYLVIFKDYNERKAAVFVEVPRRKPGFEYVSGQCTIDKKYNENITALVKTDKKLEKWQVVQRAWIVDREAAKITSVDIERVYCLNDGWGA